MKTTFKKCIAFVLCTVLLISLFATTALAHTFGTSNIYEESKEPTPKNYEWENLGAATATKQLSKYFVIETTAGEREEALYISFPAEGGFRLQSKHAYQNEVEASNVGLFEPSSIAVIDYKKDSSGAVLMTGSDGTVVRYSETQGGFSLEVLNKDQTRIIYITNYQISFGYQKDGTVVRTVVEMPMDMDKEVIYNGSNRYTTPNVVGQHFSLTNKDCFSDDDYAYGNIPFFHSNRGYSIWFNMTYPGEADFGHADDEKYSVFFNGDKLDFYLWTGTPLENIKKYTDITGTSGVPEEWVFGFWTGAASVAYNNEYNSENTDNAYQNLTELIEGYMEHYNFYPEACYAEGMFDSKTMQYGKNRGIKMLSWMRPYYSIDDMTNLFPELLVTTPQKNADGTVESAGFPYMYNQFILQKTGEYVFTQPGWMDTSNPNFKEVITRRFSNAWDWGLHGMMIDFGDQLPYYGTAYNGLSGMEMHNFHNYYYAKHTSEAWSERFGNDYVLFQRSVAPGTQYYTAHFQGDQVHDWEGYTDAIYDMISRGAGGFNLYGADLGGLRVTDASGSYAKTPNKDLWNRWIVMSTFSPFMRQHGIVIHEPWNEEAYGYASKINFGQYYYLRKNLVPTLMDAAIDANKTSNPIIKGMMLAYPYYLSLSNVSNQYLFCDDFLVCAVDSAMQHSLNVSFPSGNSWYSLFTNEMQKGGRSVVVEAPSNFMPVYIKDGSVKAINLPDSMQLMTEMHDEEDTEFSEHEALLITPPNEERKTVIYTKEGTSEDFQTYKATSETYISTPSKNEFTIKNADGSRREIVVAVGVTAAEVSYDGEELTRFDHMPDYYNKEYGYYVDLSGRTTIYLPAGWKELRILKGDTGYKRYAISDNNNLKIDRMFDNDPASMYTVPSGNTPTTVYLKDDVVQKIGRIEVKWAAGFLHGYDIEYTKDGETWELLLPENETKHTVSAGGGGIDVIEFDPVEAYAIRLTKVTLGDVNQNLVGIYEMNILAPDDFTPIVPEEETQEEPYDEFYEDEDLTPEDWEEDDDDDDEDNPAEEEEEVDGGYTTIRRKRLLYPGFPIWLVIVGGVLVIGGGVFLWLLLLKKKKKKAAQAAIDAEETDSADVLDEM